MAWCCPLLSLYGCFIAADNIGTNPHTSDVDFALAHTQFFLNDGNCFVVEVNGAVDPQIGSRALIVVSA